MTLGGVIHGAKSHIDGGEGQDTLVVTAANTAHNLAQIQNIEIIDLAKASNYELNITAKDVLNQSDTLIIKGLGENVRVDLGNNGNNLKDGTDEWAKVGTQQIDGVQYDAYSHNALQGEVIYIEQGITVL